jgi:hypothetical protein
MSQLVTHQARLSVQCLKLAVTVQLDSTNSTHLVTLEATGIVHLVTQADHQLHQLIAQLHHQPQQPRAQQLPQQQRQHQPQQPQQLPPRVTVHSLTTYVLQDLLQLVQVVVPSQAFASVSI